MKSKKYLSAGVISLLFSGITSGTGIYLYKNPEILSDYSLKNEYLKKKEKLIKIKQEITKEKEIMNKFLEEFNNKVTEKRKANNEKIKKCKSPVENNENCQKEKEKFNKLQQEYDEGKEKIDKYNSKMHSLMNEEEKLRCFLVGIYFFKELEKIENSFLDKKDKIKKLMKELLYILRYEKHQELNNKNAEAKKFLEENKIKK